MPRPVSILDLTPQEEEELQRRVQASTTSQRDSLRARIVLLRSKGIKQTDVARAVEVSVSCVNKWSQRFEREGLEGLCDKPGRGRKPSIPLETVRKVITEAGKARPGGGRWSTRTLATHLGISFMTVHRIWREHELKPHLKRTFKLSNDKRFEEKFWDVIGLYLDPPDQALVLCCDEKTQCQALERTQPGLPLGFGHGRTWTHDYKRHGTITLFASLDYITGKLIARTERKHTHVEWLRFLRQIDRETPKGLDLHLIADNYSTHKHKKVKAWLAKHPRFHMHFTPTSSSWMNLIERFFAELTRDVVRDGSFRSVRELVEAIEGYLVEWNGKPKRFQWNARGEEVLAKIQRARKALERASG